MKQILVGVDGSPGSRAAVDFAAKLARQTGRRLLLAYVAEPLASTDAGPQQTDQELRMAAQTLLDGLAQRTALTGLGVDTAVLTGKVAETLADAARTDRIDFLVVGHRDLTIPGRVLLRLLLGELAPSTGTVRLGTGLEVAYFDQLREQLDPDRSVFDSVADGSDWIEIGDVRKHVTGYLQDFLFSPDRRNKLTYLQRRLPDEIEYRTLSEKNEWT